MKIATFQNSVAGAIALGAVLLAGAVHAQDAGFPARHLASGTPVKVKLLQSLSSDDARIGDEVRAQVAGDDTSGLPTGTVLVGRVMSVHPATAKRPGVVNVQFGTRPLTGDEDAPADIASAHLTGQTARSEKAGDVSIGAGAGAVLGLSRKRKLGDAIAGAALGALGGYAVDQAQKRSAGDVDLKKGSEVTVHLDRPLTLRTVIEEY